MEAKAIARFVRISPGKARLVVDQIRGQRVEDALNTLHFSRKAAAAPIEKTLRSAIANLINRSDGETAVPPESFIVHRAFVDDGATMKRWRPRSMGRAHPILKRSCHITLMVSDGVDETEEATKE
jgi:large subunit ribosomal protein L22